jgi:uncharacterized protein
MGESTAPGGEPVKVPVWQLVLVLVGFPAVYVANSLAPWSLGLFVHRDHGFYWSLWPSVAIIHWTTLGATLLLIRRMGWRLSDIGLRLSVRSVALMLAVPVIVGAVVILLRQSMGAGEASTSLRKIMYPGPVLAEQLLWVFMSFSAGFCEEVIYRGFGITALRGRGNATWVAVVLTTTAFVFVHGIAGLFLFPGYFAAGLLFAFVFLRTRSVVPGVCLHTAIDLGAILLG